MPAADGVLMTVGFDTDKINPNAVVVRLRQVANHHGLTSLAARMDAMITKVREATLFEHCLYKTG